ncbi:MAG: alpha/beta hydrolase [Alphaproteobacteria bacterium]|nr:alpha/beta hydrolase [Alphaproteobacteria bacterium]MBV8409171.1 alpha/beta hydrolase [Alphaproteobacteria bacterium]
MRRPAIRLALAAAIGFAPVAALAQAADAPVYGPRLEGFEYPFPVQTWRFRSQGQDLEMAYMDVRPTGPANGRTVVLLHGKNFCAATWEGTIRVLAGAGFRVIAPDQIGFCKSSKPAGYQFTFEQLAGNTKALLASLGIERAILIGHSTGGMLALRHALMFPTSVDQLVLVDPIGLEDWQAKGVPWLSLDGWLAREEHVTADNIRAYERATYYTGNWDPAYERWVQMLAGMYRGPGRDVVMESSARLYDMIATQPVYYQFERVAPPVLLMIGDKDTTAIGKDLAPPAVRGTLGDYPALGKAAVARFPHAQLIEFPDLGHAPQIEAPSRFHEALLGWLQHPQAGPPQTR